MAMNRTSGATTTARRGPPRRHPTKPTRSAMPGQGASISKTLDRDQHIDQQRRFERIQIVVKVGCSRAAPARPRTVRCSRRTAAERRPERESRCRRDRKRRERRFMPTPTPTPASGPCLPRSRAGLAWYSAAALLSLSSAIARSVIARPASRPLPIASRRSAVRTFVSQAACPDHRSDDGPCLSESMITWLTPTIRLWRLAAEVSSTSVGGTCSPPCGRTR